MPNLTPLQNVFVSGELSPELYARPNFILGEGDDRINVYSRGIRELRNFWTDSRGPVRSRDGFRYLGAVIADEEITRPICAEAVFTPSQSDLFAQGCHNIDYSETLDRVVMSCDPENGFAGGLTTGVFNGTTGELIQAYPNCNRVGHKILSRQGTWGRDLLMLMLWGCGVTDREARIYDLVTFAQVGAESFNLNNQTIRGERDQDVLLNQDSGVYRMLLKSTWNDQAVSCPTGWSPLGGAAFNPVGGIPDRYLLCMFNSGLGQFGFVEYNYNGAIPYPAAGTPSVLLDPVGSDDFTTYLSNPVVIGDKIWWMFDTNQVGVKRQFMVRTDLDGTNQQQIHLWDELVTSPESGDGFDRLYYESENNSMYYMFNNTIWRYEISTDTYYQCTPAFQADLVNPNDRGNSLTRANDGKWWLMLQQVGGGPDSWGAERIEAYF